jgi:hypothetical protein
MSSIEAGRCRRCRVELACASDLQVIAMKLVASYAIFMGATGIFHLRRIAEPNAMVWQSKHLWGRGKKMQSKKFVLTTTERITLVLSIGFACLAWSEWALPSKPSGRWGWLQVLAEDFLGTNGYVRLLLVLSLVFICAFAASVLSTRHTSKGVSK